MSTGFSGMAIGKSIPNERGLIVSSLENGIRSEYQLAPDGVNQAQLADLRERYFGPSFELLSHDKYTEIWAIDEKDLFVGPEGGESVKDVASRLAKSMAVMESEFEGCAILVVSHGDPLQILQTILHAATKHKEPASDDLASILSAVQVAPILSQHRQYALNTGELRRVI
ncbi:hypothetical protein QL285_030200 [Trifolium repens]|nr:hypothetical protein QL285_030200 [Trifolium repens]